MIMQIAILRLQAYGASQILTSIFDAQTLMCNVDVC